MEYFVALTYWQLLSLTLYGHIKTAEQMTLSPLYSNT